MRIKNVLIVGNSNNESFRIAKYLEIINIKSTLIFFSRNNLDNPASVKNVFQKNKIATFEPWLIESDEDVMLNFSFFKDRIRPLAHQADLIIANQFSAALLIDFAAKMIILNTGSDLTYYCSPDFIKLRTNSWTVDFAKSSFSKSLIDKYKEFQMNQILGYQGSIGIITADKNLSRSIDNNLKLIECEGKERFKLITGVNLTKFEPKVPRRRKLFSRSYFKVVVGSRLESSMTANSDLDDKGSDKLLNYIEFALKHNFNGIFTLFSKGSLSQLFMQRLEPFVSINKVNFLPELSYYKFLRVINDSDLVIDSLGSSIPSRVSHDSLSLLKPVISNLEKEKKLLRYGETNLSLFSINDEIDFLDTINSLGRAKFETESNLSEILQVFDPLNQIKNILNRINF
jgi:hypothetical protein